jgi:pyruvate dehydrogenase E1 component alpha subunit
VPIAPAGCSSQRDRSVKLMELQREQQLLALSRRRRGLLQVIGPDGRADPETDPGLDVELVRRIYGAMVRARVVDQRMEALQRQGRVGFHVGALGEEAAIVASAAALRPQDWIFSCYREVGAALFRGFALQAYVDNMFGNANDLCQGRQMPDHITGRPIRFASVSSVIGTQIATAVGFAWAAKMKGEDLVTAVYFGDGATSANDFHSGMNFAGVFKTPTVFLLRNNAWAISVPADRQTAAACFADKGAAYGVEALRVDGNDALAVYAAVGAAVARAASGGGPTLVELVTYRMGPHTTADDPTRYRSQAEVERHRSDDPVERLRLYLESRAAWSGEEEERLLEEIGGELRECIERAESAPAPPLSTIFQAVYAEQPAYLREQQQQCEAGPRAEKR